MKYIVICIALSNCIFIPAMCQTTLSPINKINELNCAQNQDSQASSTDAATGKGIQLYQVNASLDVIPPCNNGVTPQEPIAEFPMQVPIPQLVKIISDAGQCSGILISQDAVLTAGHCVFDAAKKQYYKHMTISPGYQRGKSDYGAPHAALKILTFSGYTSSSIAAHDVAVVRFSNQLDAKFNYFGLEAFNVNYCAQQPTPLKEYFEPHYSPNIENNSVQSNAEGQVGFCVQGMITTGLPLLPGSSGSGVLDEYSRAIFAVHSQYDSKMSYNAILTKAKICVIKAFLEETTDTLTCGATYGN
uniref:trypsin-like serine peptidase n=1 Tax=uncultured Rhizobium sp. TaxID=155567 RepID=UPI002637E888|nr:serine protease [uncultured Rhizobium sp.]